MLTLEVVPAWEVVGAAEAMDVDVVTGSREAPLGVQAAIPTVIGSMSRMAARLTDGRLLDYEV